MITVNDKVMPWEEGLSFAEIYEFLGYTLKEPVVTVKVNGEIIPREKRAGFSIPDGSIIEIVNVLRGG